MLGRECAHESMQANADFWPKSGEGGGLKNRHTRERRSWISQVRLSRTLSVYGEVAERLKAAVC